MRYILLILVFVSPYVFSEDKNLELMYLPYDLKNLAEKYNCNPYFELFEAGAYNPPFAFGFLPNEFEDSNAIMYCGNKLERKLLVYISEKYGKIDFSCPIIVKGDFITGGIKIERKKIQLDKFSFLKDPVKKGPSIEIPEANVIRSELEGGTTQLYCFKGSWLIATELDI